MIKKFHKRKFIRNDGEELFLFGRKQHTEKNTSELEITPSSKPHMRWHPGRKEWVTYSPGRKNRTAFPPKEYCPLCPSGNLNYPSEIPFKEFEIAVFPNRWSSFNTHNEKINISGVETNISNGKCEVVVYSSGHEDTIAEMPLDRIELLVQTWIDRYK